MAKKLHIKFRPGVSAQQRRDVVHALESAGATDVRPLFPRDPDEDLSLLFVVESSQSDTCKALLRLLQSRREIEFAEEEASRKLMR